MKSFQPKEAANGAERAADDAGPGRAGDDASTAEPVKSGDPNPAERGGATASVSADGGDAGLVQDRARRRWN